MEEIYQHKVEESMNKAIPNIAFYFGVGLLTGSLLETIMPEMNNDKDSIALFLEIFAQITLLVFMFMFVSSKGGVRTGLIVFLLTAIGTQPSLFLKMKTLRETILGIKKKEVSEDLTIDNETDNVEDYTDSEKIEQHVSEDESTNNDLENTKQQVPVMQAAEPAPPAPMQQQTMLDEQFAASLNPGSTSINSLPFAY